MKYMHTIGLQIAGLYCQPFFSQFSKAKTSKGHFQEGFSTEKCRVCAAVGCTRRTGSGQQHGHRLYSFPLQNPDLLKQMASQNEKEGLRPHKEFPAVFGTLFGYLFPGGLVRKVRRCGEVPQRRADVTSRIAALADSMASS